MLKLSAWTRSSIPRSATVNHLLTVIVDLRAEIAELRKDRA